MNDNEAMTYATSSVVGGDMVYDAMKAGDRAFWNTASHIADKTGSKYVDTVRNMQSNTQYNGTTDKLDTWMNKTLNGGTDYKPPRNLDN